MKEQLSANRAEFLKPYPEKPVNRDEFIKTIEAGGFSVEGENITPLDYFSTPEDISENKMKKLIANILGIEANEVKNNLEKIEKCLEESKEFITQVLKQSLPREILNINSFKSIKDLMRFLSHTKTLKNNDKMGYAPFYCAVVSVMLAIWEYHKENFQNLKNEATYVDEKIFEETEDGSANFRFFQAQKDPAWSYIGIFTDKKKMISAGYSYRGKGEQSGILKVIKTPELNAKEIITDGVGLKFEVNSIEDAKKLIEFLSQYFEKKFQAEKMIISNIGNLASEKDLEEIKKNLKDYEIHCSGFNKNRHSNKHWQALKLEGIIRLPKNGEEGRIMVTRNFEIQITLVNNKNESGMARHEIYKGVQKLSAYTRLFGSFTEEYLDMICEEASQESGISSAKIKRYIQKYFLVKLKTTRHKKVKYASKEHIKRWQKTGKMPSAIQIIGKLD